MILYTSLQLVINTIREKDAWAIKTLSIMVNGLLQFYWVHRKVSFLLRYTILNVYLY